MVAHQVDGGHAGQGIAGGQALDHGRAVGAAIDVVADMNQQGVGHRAGSEIGGDGGMQRPEAVGAAMDVADGVDAVAVRQQSRGILEGNHAAATWGLA